MKHFFSPQQVQLFRSLAAIGAQYHVRVCLVGGVVRDLLLQHELLDHDIDFMVEGPAAELAQAVAATYGGAVTLHERFLTAKVRGIHGIPGVDEIDIATARTELYESPAALPRVQAATIEADLMRRDFSINACALELSALLGSVDTSVETVRAAVLDTQGGVADLDRKVVRTLHSKSFQDDPTRIFRAARYAARLDAVIDSRTEQELLSEIAAGGLARLSATRVWNEWKRVCQEEHPAQALGLLRGWGVFAAVPYFSSFESIQIERRCRELEQNATWLHYRGSEACALALLRAGSAGDVEEFRKAAGISKRIAQESAELFVQLQW